MKLNLTINNNENSTLHLKKAVLTIFEYHKNNKTILFLGNSSEIKSKYRKNITKTKHIFLSNSHWSTGLLTNKISFIKSLKKKNSTGALKDHNLRRYLMKKKRPDLLVILSTDFNLDVYKEASKLKIPIISFTQKDFNDYILHSINLTKTSNTIKISNFVFYLLNSLFKKD